jgi:hypothetical protein
MIRDFAHHFWFNDTVLCYYGLHDLHSPWEDADWGLVDDNDTLRISGEALKTLLLSSGS